MTTPLALDDTLDKWEKHCEYSEELEEICGLPTWVRVLVYVAAAEDWEVVDRGKFLSVWRRDGCLSVFLDPSKIDSDIKRLLLEEWT